MDKLVAITNIEQVARQRNLFLILTLMMGLSASCLSVMLLAKNQRTILVPGLSQEIWVEGKGVSRSLLEETTYMYLPLLLDLSANEIDHRAGIIFKYVSQSEPIYIKKMQEYFTENKLKYKKFGLSTYFSTKNLEIDRENMLVTANGTLTSTFGEGGYESKPTSYQLSYEWTSGKLRLKEFIRVKTTNEQEQELKNLQEEEEQKKKFLNESEK